MPPKGTLWPAVAFDRRSDWEGAGVMDWLGLTSILLLVAGMMAASWIAVRCGIRAPIKKEGEEGKEV